MPENKKILLYSPIYRETAEAFVEKLLQVDSSEDIDVLYSSPGGSVFAGWGMIGPLAERTGKNHGKVYGDASSMALFSLLFMDTVEAIDVSNFTLHRADGYTETDDDKAFLAKVNKDIRSKLEAKINPDIFKEVTGITLNEVFDPNKRINVNLSAKDAKKIGLIDKVIRLEPKQLKALNNKFVAFFDFDENPERGSNGESEKDVRGSTEKSEENNNTNVKSSKMDKNKLIAEHPGVYQEILNEGIAKEKDRVEAFLEFIDIDAESVKKNISEGSNITNKFMAEMTRKGISAEKLEELKEDSPEEIEAKKKEAESKVKTEGKNELEAFEKDVNSVMGLKEEVIS